MIQNLHIWWNIIQFNLQIFFKAEHLTGSCLTCAAWNYGSLFFFGFVRGLNFMALFCLCPHASCRGGGGSQVWMMVTVPIVKPFVKLASRPVFLFTFPLHQNLFFMNKRFSCKIQIWACHTHARSFRKNLIIDWKAFLSLSSPVPFNIIIFTFYCTRVFTEIWQWNTHWKNKNAT